MTLVGLWPLFLVGTGGFFGAVCRYRLSSIVARRFPSSIPYGTLTVNLSGCFLLGWTMRFHAYDEWKLLLGTGFLGAFTTFSTFKLESVKLLKHKQMRSWLLYTGLSYSLGLSLVFIGYYL